MFSSIRIKSTTVLSHGNAIALAIHISLTASVRMLVCMVFNVRLCTRFVL